MSWCEIPIPHPFPRESLPAERRKTEAGTDSCPPTCEKGFSHQNSCCRGNAIPDENGQASGLFSEQPKTIAMKIFSQVRDAPPSERKESGRKVDRNAVPKASGGNRERRALEQEKDHDSVRDDKQCSERGSGIRC